MRLQGIYITEFKGNIQIERVSEDDYDPDIWDQAEEIPILSGINIARNKELTFVAKDDNDNVHGAIWSSFEQDDNENYVFDFDVAVLPSSRAHAGLHSARVGPQLIDAAIEEFNCLQSEFQNVYIRLWVINPKLARWLENNRNFDVESQHGDGSAHMVYYG